MCRSSEVNEAPRPSGNHQAEASRWETDHVLPLDTPLVAAGDRVTAMQDTHTILPTARNLSSLSHYTYFSLSFLDVLITPSQTYPIYSRYPPSRISIFSNRSFFLAILLKYSHNPHYFFFQSFIDVLIIPSQTCPI